MLKAKSKNAPSPLMQGEAPARFLRRSNGLTPALQSAFNAPEACGASPTGLLDEALSADSPEVLPARETFAQSQKRSRRFDLSVAVLVSVGAHFSLVLLSQESEAVVATVEAPAPMIEITVLEMPVFDEPPVEVSDSEPTDAQPIEFAPPMQADLPSFVSVDSFVQPMQAPVPSGISTDIGMLTVPPRTQIGQGGNVPKLFDIADLDRVPNRLRTAAPNYPMQFRRARVEGDVVLLVIIDETGRVRVDRIISATNQDFAEAARSAAEQCRYEAPIKGGVRVSARYTLRVPFRLE